MSKWKVLILGFFILLGYQLVKPSEIVAAHSGRVLLVEGFPKVKLFQILWWYDNKEVFNDKLSLADNDRSYDFVVHNFGNGYKVYTHQDSDLLCFYEMKEKSNCIVKEPLFIVKAYGENKIKFISY
ncbi:DUF943 family protein [Rouxiella sp. T17]|uniref:DUF943 family protein n=1 Tax=Rouxiella sp. T17 TaxID=3085684 RepID=UPI002FC8072E